MSKEIEHGTYSAYFNGCTCQPCKDAGSAVRRNGTLDRFLAGKTRKPPLFNPWDRTTPYDDTDPRHGTLGGYTWGCRCPWCRQAGIDYRAHKKLGLKLPKGYNAKHAEGGI